jgi:hypothetical protein
MASSLPMQANGAGTAAENRLDDVAGLDWHGRCQASGDYDVSVAECLGLRCEGTPQPVQSLQGVSHGGRRGALGDGDAVVQQLDRQLVERVGGSRGPIATPAADDPSAVLSSRVNR